MSLTAYMKRQEENLMKEIFKRNIQTIMIKGKKFKDIAEIDQIMFVKIYCDDPGAGFLRLHPDLNDIDAALLWKCHFFYHSGMNLIKFYEKR
jgi:hypothetical protein